MKNRSRLIFLIVLGGVIACGMGAMLLLTRDPSSVLNVLIPLATLGVLCAMGLRQRQVSAEARARLHEAAAICSKMAVLSEALEAAYLQRLAPPSKSENGFGAGHEFTPKTPSIH